MMVAALAGPGARGRAWPLAALALAGFLAAFAAGCSEDTPPQDSASVQGKTPVVRPEDVHARGPGGASVLAPDYRQEMTADLDAAASGQPLRAGSVPAVGPASSRPEPRPTPLFEAKSVAAPPTAPAPAVTTAPAAAAAKAAPPTAPAPAVPAAPVPDAAKTAARLDVPAPTSGKAGPPSGPTGDTAGFPLADCRQLVLVLAPDMAAHKGALRRFERQGPGAPWREAGGAVSCALGRKGLGYGRGLLAMPDAPAKREGDGRTPAGLFSLPEAFGYADEAAARAGGVKLPYVAVTDRVACVTDPVSPLFGSVVGPDARPGGGFSRQDRMARDDKANLWGVVVGHNRNNPEPGAGACVFVNVRPAGGPPTGGSIGCPEDAAAALAAWLDPAAKPVLAVLPQSLYQERRAAWGLP